MDITEFQELVDSTKYILRQLDERLESANGVIERAETLKGKLNQALDIIEREKRSKERKASLSDSPVNTPSPGKGFGI